MYIMPQPLHRNRPLAWVLMAQFCSAWADNALLIIAIALLKQQGLPEQVPWLQASFMIPFILLAPFVGAMADHFSKGCVMFIANGIKLSGAALILLQFPLIGYFIAGIGATLYSPAKYGILGQLVSPEHLVRANGWLEGSTIVAILTGVVLGGLLADSNLGWALTAVIGMYLLASMINLAIPQLPRERTTPIIMTHLWREFWQNSRILIQHTNARLSLFSTSIFWSAGASLRLMLFAWVPAIFLVTDNQLPSTMMGMVSIGIVMGAGYAAWKLSIQDSRRALWAGLCLGPILFALSLTESHLWAFVWLIGLGTAGGILIVPLNALLQHTGQQTVGSGSALALQNLFENSLMFISVSMYGMLMNSYAITSIMQVFALLILLFMLGIMLSSRQQHANEGL